MQKWKGWVIALAAVGIVVGCSDSGSDGDKNVRFTDELVSGQVVYFQESDNEEEKSSSQLDLEEGTTVLRVTFKSDNTYIVESSEIENVPMKVNEWEIIDGKLVVDGGESVFTLVSATSTTWVVRENNETESQTWYLQQPFTEDLIEGKKFSNYRDGRIYDFNGSILNVTDPERSDGKYDFKCAYQIKDQNLEIIECRAINVSSSPTTEVHKIFLISPYRDGQTDTLFIWHDLDETDTSNYFPEGIDNWSEETDDVGIGG
jgi:hypothetical protein